MQHQLSERWTRIELGQALQVVSRLEVVQALQVHLQGIDPQVPVDWLGHEASQNHHHRT